MYLLESCRTELEAEQKRHKEFADHELRQRQAYAQLQHQVTLLFGKFNLGEAAWLIEKCIELTLTHDVIKDCA